MGGELPSEDIGTEDEKLNETIKEEPPK